VARLGGMLKAVEISGFQVSLVAKLRKVVLFDFGLSHLKTEGLGSTPFTAISQGHF
jgi:uncharacterized membrane protein YczE